MLCSPPSCLQASECTFIFTCEGQLSLGTSMVWLLIFQGIILSLFYLRYTTFWKCCYVYEILLKGVLEHRENKVALPTDLTKLRWCHRQQLKGSFEGKATHSKLKLHSVKTSPCPWLNISIGKVSSGNSSQARDQCDRRIRNCLQGILISQTTAMSAETEDMIREWNLAISKGLLSNLVGKQYISKYIKYSFHRYRMPDPCPECSWGILCSGNQGWEGKAKSLAAR